MWKKDPIYSCKNKILGHKLNKKIANTYMKDLKHDWNTDKDIPCSQ